LRCSRDRKIILERIIAEAINRKQGQISFSFDGFDFYCFSYFENLVSQCFERLPNALNAELLAFVIWEGQARWVGSTSHDGILQLRL
jgi:hypothetical protein